MSPPKLIITKQDLIAEPCSFYNDLPEGEFDAGEEIMKHGNNYCHVSWLIANCRKAQTGEWFEYYKSLKPDYADVFTLIINCKKAQTNEWFEYFKSLKPNYLSVLLLIVNCKKAQTKKWFDYFKSLNPDDWTIRWLIDKCPKAKNYFKTKTKQYEPS
jgi:hypothetical protein